MNIRRGIAAIVLIFVIAMLWKALFHMLLIAEMNAMINDLRRSDLADKIPLSLLITLGMAILFVISYSKWLRNGTLIERVIHGLFFALLAGIFVNANQYFVYPVAGMLASLWFFGGLVEFFFYAVVVWFVYSYGKQEAAVEVN